MAVTKINVDRNMNDGFEDKRRKKEARMRGSEVK